MKFWKAYVALAVFVGLLLWPVQSQPPQHLEKPLEAKLPSLSAAQLSDIIGGPTKVSLHYENADFNAVMKDASEKFDVPLALSAQSGPKGPVTLDLKDAPLWAVYEALRTQVQPDRNGPKATPYHTLLIFPDSIIYATQETPLFQVRTSGLRAHATGWTMAIYLLTDPKFEIALSTGGIRLTEAIDEQGNNLLVDEVRSSSISSTVPALYLIPLSQRGAKPKGHKLVRLRGVVAAYAIVKRKAWEVPLKNLPQEKTIMRDGRPETLTISELQREGKERYKVELSRVYKSLIDYRFWNSTQMGLNHVSNYALFSRVQLLDAQGHKFYLQQIKTDVNYNDEAYSFDWTGHFERTPEDRRDSDILPEGEPVKLIWSLPGEIHRFEIPFELTDVPIN